MYSSVKVLKNKNDEVCEVDHFLVILYVLMFEFWVFKQEAIG